jgi:hypothetical protein
MGCSKSQKRSWVETAHQLREVRRACSLFLDRWAIGHLVGAQIQAGLDPALDDFTNRDWSMLYRGSVLDD